MGTYDTTAYLVIGGSGDTTPSLPDPTTVAGRTHLVVNEQTVSGIWTSTGATPFKVNGLNVASLTIPAGGSVNVQSDGVRWVVPASTVAARRVFAGNGVSDASGNVVFTFSPAFAAVPVVAQAIQTTNSNATEARVTALSASSCTVNVRQSPGVVILGISVLQVPQPLVGATVNLVAFEAGQV